MCCDATTLLEHLDCVARDLCERRISRLDLHIRIMLPVRRFTAVLNNRKFDREKGLPTVKRHSCLPMATSQHYGEAAKSELIVRVSLQFYAVLRERFKHGSE